MFFASASLNGLSLFELSKLLTCELFNEKFQPDFVEWSLMLRYNNTISYIISKEASPKINNLKHPKSGFEKMKLEIAFFWNQMNSMWQTVYKQRLRQITSPTPSNSS